MTLPGSITTAIQHNSTTITGVLATVSASPCCSHLAPITLIPVIGTQFILIQQKFMTHSGIHTFSNLLSTHDCLYQCSSGHSLSVSPALSPVCWQSHVTQSPIMVPWVTQPLLTHHCSHHSVRSCILS